MKYSEIPIFLNDIQILRYFLSGILQMDLFKSLCEITVLGRNSKNKEEEKILPLQRCDIYGSKKAGKHLR